MGTLTVVWFVSPIYPEDTKILGIYSTDERCNWAIDQAIEFDRQCYPRHPRRTQQNPLYYYKQDFNVNQ